MLTREQALEAAREVIANKTRSHVAAARDLAIYVLSEDRAMVRALTHVADSLPHCRSCGAAEDTRTFAEAALGRGPAQRKSDAPTSKATVDADEL